MRCSRPRLASSLCVLVACTSPTAPVAEGLWGGPSASLVLSSAGGQITYDCGWGTIDAGWIITAAGRFSATGQHFFGSGPQPPGQVPPRPAAYSGRVHQNTLAFTVKLKDSGEVLGTVYLRRDGPAMVNVCD